MTRCAAPAPAPAPAAAPTGLLLVVVAGSRGGGGGCGWSASSIAGAGLNWFDLKDDGGLLINSAAFGAHQTQHNRTKQPSVCTRLLLN